MNYRPIVTDDTKQEITNFDIEDFPLILDKQPVSRKDIVGIPHWHYEIQISVVTKGSVIFRTQKGDFLLHEGEGIFICSGVMHEIISTEDNNSEYYCYNFDPRILSGENDKLIRRKYVDPVLASPEMQLFLLKEEKWHKKICSLVVRAGEISDSENFVSELSMKSILYRIWEIVVYNNQDYLKEKMISQMDRERLDVFLSFIHQHYMDQLTLADIARAGNVSRGECCRLFKRTGNTSPVAYLTRYRIRQSIKLLTCTSRSIAEIAQQTGFNTSSYFTECFKKETGMSPLKYRNIVCNIGNENGDK